MDDRDFLNSLTGRDPPDFVCEGLFIGDELSLGSNLKSQGIRAIINCAAEVYVPCHLGNCQLVPWQNLATELLLHPRLGCICSTLVSSYIMDWRSKQFMNVLCCNFRDDGRDNVLVVVPSLQLFFDHYSALTSVLVNCYAGISRSAAVCLALLINRHTLWDAWQILKLARPRACPNREFLLQLIEIEKKTKKKSTVKLSKFPCSLEPL